MVSASSGRHGVARIGIALIAAASFCLQAGVPAAAGVRSSTEVRAYRVGGTTAAGLVNYMRTSPFHGDRGSAVANIRPNYSLSVVTKGNGASCKASKVDLGIRFVMTLPKATSEGALPPSTRTAWNSFVGFARRHEETHRSIYLGCANAFVAKAMRLTSDSGCAALQANIRRLLETEKRACDAKHLAFDARDYARVFGLSLFSMAKYSGQPAKVVSKKKPADSSSIAAPAR